MNITLRRYPNGSCDLEVGYFPGLVGCTSVDRKLPPFCLAVHCENDSEETIHRALLTALSELDALCCVCGDPDPNKIWRLVNQARMGSQSTA